MFNSQRFPITVNVQKTKKLIIIIIIIINKIHFTDDVQNQ